MRVSHKKHCYSSHRAHYNTFDGADPGAPLLSYNLAVYTPSISEHRADGSHFYANDALGSPRSIRNSSGSMTDDERFEAFGGTVFHGGTSPTTTPYGWEAGKAHYQTDTSGLILMGHRFYDSSTGRFLSPDPVHDGENWYAYCENNPLGRIDPTGLTPTPPGWNDQWTQDNNNDDVSPDGNETWHWDPRRPDSPKDADHDDHWDVDTKHSDHTERGKYFPDRNNGAGKYEQRGKSKSQDVNRNKQKAQAEQNRRERAANRVRSQQGQAPKQFHPYAIPTLPMQTPTFRMSPEEMPTIRIIPLEELFPVPG